MKLRNIISNSFVATAIALTSCNALEFDQSTGYLTAEEVYATFSNTQSLLTHLYSYLESDWGSVDSAMRDCASDDAHYVWSDSNVHIFNDGRWSAINTVDDKWSNYFMGIRQANEFLENFAAANFESYKNTTTYDTWVEQAQYWSYEARFLRAYCHFELARRYGDIPLVADTIYTTDDVNSVEKSSFKEVVDYIASECKEIAGYLPVDYASVSGQQTGRITQGAAKALKAKALLFAASTTYNPDATNDDWKAAAEAANEVIEMGQYSLESTLFPFDNGTSAYTSVELILERRQAASAAFEKLNTSISFENGNTGTCPTQNLVDAFETVNGYKVIYDETTGKFKSDDTAFNPDAPYANRDARLAATILCDGDSWMGHTMACYEGGVDGSAVLGGSQTGYYLRKYLSSSVELSPVVTTAIHSWVIFRYAGILLNYAEAMNEAYGAEESHSYTYTALEALNLIRARAGQPEIATASDSELRELIRNERRVELAFENQRFWDIRRWGVGDSTNDITGVKITKASDSNAKSYALKSVETRKWADKMYLYPIPVNETYMNPNLTQNTGW